MSRNQQPDFETIVCDLANDNIPINTMNGIDTVFHLAGYAHDVRYSPDEEHLYRKVNVDATVKIADLAELAGVRRFIYVSSVKAGGSSLNTECLTEDDQNKPIDIYGITKREAELSLLKLSKKSNMQITIIRPALVYGKNPKGNLQTLLSGVYKGWFPPITEIRNKRSMIHVDDLVRVLLLIAENENTNGEIYIATDGKTYSSREIYNIFCEILGKKVPGWAIPNFILNILASFSPILRFKINKLLSNECYSSEKLKSLGFRAKFTLKEMNETYF